jgi:hypothetical protein
MLGGIIKKKSSNNFFQKFRFMREDDNSVDSVDGNDISFRVVEKENKTKLDERLELMRKRENEINNLYINSMNNNKQVNDWGSVYQKLFKNVLGNVKNKKEEIYSEEIIARLGAGIGYKDKGFNYFESVNINHKGNIHELLNPGVNKNIKEIIELVKNHSVQRKLKTQNNFFVNKKDTLTGKGGGTLTEKARRGTKDKGGNLIGNIGGIPLPSSTPTYKETEEKTTSKKNSSKRLNVVIFNNLVKNPNKRDSVWKKDRFSFRKSLTAKRHAARVSRQEQILNNSNEEAEKDDPLLKEIKKNKMLLEMQKDSNNGVKTKGKGNQNTIQKYTNPVQRVLCYEQEMANYKDLFSEETTYKMSNDSSRTLKFINYKHFFNFDKNSNSSIKKLDKKEEFCVKIDQLVNTMKKLKS